MKKCKQCGEHKDIEMYRPLYRAKGHYNYCLECESVNNRYKYLRRRFQQGNITSEQVSEKTTIEEYYALLRVKGLNPPETRQEKQLGIYKAVKDLKAEIEAQIGQPGLAQVDHLAGEYRRALPEQQDKSQQWSQGCGSCAQRAPVALGQQGQQRPQQWQRNH